MHGPSQPHSPRGISHKEPQQPQPPLQPLPRQIAVGEAQIPPLDLTQTRPLPKEQAKPLGERQVVTTQTTSTFPTPEIINSDVRAMLERIGNYNLTPDPPDRSKQYPGGYPQVANDIIELGNYLKDPRNSEQIKSLDPDLVKQMNDLVVNLVNYENPNFQGNQDKVLAIRVDAVWLAHQMRNKHILTADKFETELLGLDQEKRILDQKQAQPRGDGPMAKLLGENYDSVEILWKNPRMSIPRENEALKQELSDTKNQMAQLQTTSREQLESHQAEIRQMKEDFQREKEALERQLQQSNEEKTNVLQLNEKLSEAQKQNENLKKDLEENQNKASQNLDELRQNTEKLQSQHKEELNKKDQENQTLREQLDKAQKQNENLKKDLEENQSIASRSLDELKQNTQKQAKETEQLQSQHKGELNKKDQENQTLQEQLDKTQKEVDELKEKLQKTDTTQKSQLGRLTEENETLKDAIELLKKEIEEKNETLSKLRSTLDQLFENAKSTQATQEANELQIAQLKEDLKKSEAEKLPLANELTLLKEGNLRDIQTSIQAAKQTLHHLTTNLSNLVKNFATIVHKNADLKHNVEYSLADDYELQVAKKEIQDIETLLVEISQAQEAEIKTEQDEKLHNDLLNKLLELNQKSAEALTKGNNAISLIETQNNKLLQQEQNQTNKLLEESLKSLVNVYGSLSTFNAGFEPEQPTKTQKSSKSKQIEEFENIQAQISEKLKKVRTLLLRNIQFYQESVLGVGRTTASEIFPQEQIIPKIFKIEYKEIYENNKSRKETVEKLKLSPMNEAVKESEEEWEETIEDLVIESKLSLQSLNKLLGKIETDKKLNEKLKAYLIETLPRLKAVMIPLIAPLLPEAKNRETVRVWGIFEDYTMESAEELNKILNLSKSELEDSTNTRLLEIINTLLVFVQTMIRPEYVSRFIESFNKTS